MIQCNANNVVVFDFETTGLSPRMGDRPIEIGAVRIAHGQVVDRFQALMNPGKRVSTFIESFTGISNHMLLDAPPCEQVMHRFCDFVGDAVLVAHNASFDKAFLNAELEKIERSYSAQVCCSMLLARRLLRDAPNHKLATLVDYLNIEQQDGEFHRALYDAEMTAKLWLSLLDHIRQQYQIEFISVHLIQKVLSTPAKSVARLLQDW